MNSLSKHIKNTFYFVFFSYFIALIALGIYYSKISDFNFQTTTESTEQCSSSHGDTDTSGDSVCSIYIVEKRWEPYVIPALLYAALIIFGLVHINRELKKVVTELDDFNTNTQIEIQTMEKLDHKYQFIELNNAAEILSENIDTFKNNQQRQHDYINYVMHDLKTPLQVIRGYVDLLKSGIINEDYFNVIETQVKHIDSIAETTSYISGYVASIETVNMNKVLADIKDHYMAIYPTMEFVLESNEVAWNVDYDGLIRCLHNLINNSLESEGDDKYISVKLIEDKITIIDNGSGLDQDEFIKYVNMTEGKESHFGLKIVDTIIKANDLTINFTKLEEGTKVIIENKTN